MKIALELNLKGCLETPESRQCEAGNNVYRSPEAKGYRTFKFHRKLLGDLKDQLCLVSEKWVEGQIIMKS